MNTHIIVAWDPIEREYVELGEYPNKYAALAAKRSFEKGDPFYTYYIHTLRMSKEWRYFGYMWSRDAKTAPWTERQRPQECDDDELPF